MSRGMIVFWAVFIGALAWDYSVTGHPRVEPAPLALGSGEMSTGGHCSGK